MRGKQRSNRRPTFSFTSKENGFNFTKKEGHFSTSSPFVFKDLDLKEVSQETNSNATANTAQQLFAKVNDCFPSSNDVSTLNEEEQKALTAFESLDASKYGRIKVSELLFLFDDIGEDFHGEEFDKQSQMLDPSRSGFIERSTFIDWYCKLFSKRVSQKFINPRVKLRTIKMRQRMNI